MLRKLLLSFLVWIIVAVVLELVGNLIGGQVGIWLQNNNILIGFLAGIVYFVWGYNDRRI